MSFAQHASLARPYADALYQTALSENHLERYLGWLEAAAAVFEDEAVISKLSNPLIPVSVWLSCIESISTSKVSDVFEKFIDLCAEQNRLLILPHIYRHYRALYQEKEALLDVLIKTARPLGVDYKKRLEKALSQRYQKKIVLCEIHDPTLLGGAMVQIGDQVLDSSVTGRLKQLQQTLEL